MSNDGVSWLRFVTFVSLFDRINSIRFVFHSISLRFVFLSSVVLCCCWLFHLYISLIFCWIGYFCLVCVCTNNNNCDYYLLCNCDRVEYCTIISSFSFLFVQQVSIIMILIVLEMDVDEFTIVVVLWNVSADSICHCTINDDVVAGGGGGLRCWWGWCARRFLLLSLQKKNDSIFELISLCTNER